jgi:hypothetical protein
MVWEEKGREEERGSVAYPCTTQQERRKAQGTRRSTQMDELTWVKTALLFLFFLSLPFTFALYKFSCGNIQRVLAKMMRPDMHLPFTFFFTEIKQLLAAIIIRLRKVKRNACIIVVLQSGYLLQRKVQMPYCFLSF